MNTMLMSALLILMRLGTTALALDGEQEAEEGLGRGTTMHNMIDKEGYACEKIFAFGLWGCEPRRYQLGLEGLLRDVRRLHMNCFLYGPPIGNGSAGIAQLKRDVELCRRYGVFVMPNGGSDVSRIRKLASAL